MISKLLKKKSTTMVDIPACLPFKTVKELAAFDSASDEVYDAVVSRKCNMHTTK